MQWMPGPHEVAGGLVSDTLEALVAGAMGVPAGEVRLSDRPPLAYQSNRLIDAWVGGQHLIVKEFLKPDEFGEAPVREYRALQLLAPLDIAPQPVCAVPQTGSRGPIVIYRFMEGAMWDRRRPTPGELAQLAEAWLLMNSVPADGLWPSRGHLRSPDEIVAGFRATFQAYAAWTESEFDRGRAAATHCLALLECRRGVAAELAGCEPLLCFCRADQRFANVIRRPDGRLGLVDWEDSGLRDPARDLADLLTHANHEDMVSTEEWDAFLQPYVAARAPLDTGLPHRTHLYLAAFPLFWLHLLVREGLRRAATGRLVGWDVNGLPANERLRRYLARGEAWPAGDFAARLESLAELAFFPSC
jgi:hypothetical protein